MTSTFSYEIGQRVFTGRTNIRDKFEELSDAPLIVALHGGSYTSAYFDVPGYSLLEVASRAGLPVVAIDRPNYGGSSPLETSDSIILANAEVIGEAIGPIAERLDRDSVGVVLIGHSIGGAIATAIAATSPSWPLVGLATSGCLVQVPQESRIAAEQLPDVPFIARPLSRKDRVMFGPPGTYAEDMPTASHEADSRIPRAEVLDITGLWIEERAAVCEAVTVPVHHRQGEFDALWITDESEVDEYRAGFSRAESTDIQLHPKCGHCIDFHLSGSEFQESQLRFARGCVSYAAS